MYSEELKTNCRNIKPIKLSVSKVPAEISFKEELIKKTSFLSYDKIPLVLRYFCVLNDIFEIPKCECCDNIVAFNKAYPDKGFAKYCSPICSRSDKTVSKDILEKLSNKDWLYQQRITLQKSKEQIAKELGCSTIPVTKWLEIHGLETKRTDIKNQKEDMPDKEFLLDLYMNKEYTILDIAKELNVSNTLVGNWFDFYGIIKLPHSQIIKERVVPKIKTSVLSRYGVEHSSQIHFSKEILEKLNDPRWLYKEHIVNKRTLTDISNILGVSDITVKNYFKKYNIETKLYSFSREEQELSEFIEQFVRIERNARNIIYPKELDIFIPIKNIAIEYNGCFWHSTQVNKNNFHQFEKYKLCEEQGIRLITIYDDEWKYKKEIVKLKLKNILNFSDEKRIFARKCSIEIIKNKKIVEDFQNNTHIQGYSKSSINLGLFFNNELVSIMSFKHNNSYYELTRFSTKYKVVGGFSKLLNYFRKNFEKKEIITFSDLRWHKGETYLNSGFIIDKILKPDYQYLINHKREHKFNFRLKQIKRKFPTLFNPSESEFENMDRIGIPRIYDCGKIRYILK